MLEKHQGMKDAEDELKVIQEAFANALVGELNKRLNDFNTRIGELKGSAKNKNKEKEEIKVTMQEHRKTSERSMLCPRMLHCELVAILPANLLFLAVQQ